MTILILKFFFLDFLYESVFGKLTTTTTILTPVGNSQESKNVQGNLFIPISAVLSICLETITINLER